ncbi:MAG TPA: protein-methionine-sulfoxide reductase heme-binding subunit MsrQ [Pyrinomonadaceae bacterium]|nr:protein-methionine-sulfoxide reductase heme-binding subunit MsrQ [Pyrinomonadaceae bacterium]
MKKVSFSKVILFVNALVPLTLLLWDFFRKQLGANPGEYLTRTTGMLTLLFLMLTLAVSPIRKIFGWNSIIKLRRPLGLFAFFYGFTHLLTYIAFDRFFKIASIPKDVWSRPFITFGMLAFFLMIPLAITSTNQMVKRLGGKVWSRLHKAVYAAGLAGALHFWLFVKSDYRLPLTFGFVLLLLLAHRLLVKFYPPGIPGTGNSVVPGK